MNRPFRKARLGPVLSREAGTRQGRAVRVATAAFGSSAAVRSFLNSHHDGLSGRPLDLAVASDAGLAAVEAAIGVEARRAAAAG
jgi:uncharacterized protein (DUF2384 family)